MSKFVKDLLSKDLANRLDGVTDCILADVVGMDAIASTDLRKRLRDKGIGMMVVKNSLARRATEGTSLAPAFEGIEGSHAVLWGSEDFVSSPQTVTDSIQGRAMVTPVPRRKVRRLKWCEVFMGWGGCCRGYGGTGG